MGLLHCIIDTMSVLRAWERAAAVLFEEYLLFVGGGAHRAMPLKEWLISYRVVDEDILHVVEKALVAYGVTEVSGVHKLEETDDMDHFAQLSLKMNTESALRYILGVFNELKIEHLKKVSHSEIAVEVRLANLILLLEADEMPWDEEEEGKVALPPCTGVTFALSSGG